MFELDGKHCDDFIRDKAQPKCLRKFLLYHRIPAAWLYGRWRDSWGVPKLFATHNGKRVRVVMASRMGDVGITPNLNRESGYADRVLVDKLSEFSDEK